MSIGDLIKEKYGNFYGTIYENKEALSRECATGEIGVIHDRYWTEFGVLLCEITDNNMWTEIVIIGDI